MVHQVRLDRLRQVAAPFFGWVARAKVMGFPAQRAYLDAPARAAAIAAYGVDSFWDYAWDYGRVRHFVEQLDAGVKLDPIELESESFQYRIGAPISWGAPRIEDGNHRLAAAAICELKTIPVTFSGVVSTIEWLTGTRKRRPLELR